MLLHQPCMIGETGETKVSPTVGCVSPSGLWIESITYFIKCIPFHLSAASFARPRTLIQAWGKWLGVERSMLDVTRSALGAENSVLLDGASVLGVESSMPGIESCVLEVGSCVLGDESWMHSAEHNVVLVRA